MPNCLTGINAAIGKPIPITEDDFANGPLRHAVTTVWTVGLDAADYLAADVLDAKLIRVPLKQVRITPAHPTVWDTPEGIAPIRRAVGDIHVFGVGVQHPIGCIHVSTVKRVAGDFGAWQGVCAE